MVLTVQPSNHMTSLPSLLSFTYAVKVSENQTWQQVISSLPVTGKAGATLVPEQVQHGHFRPYYDEDDDGFEYPYTVTITPNGQVFSNSIETRAGDPSELDTSINLPAGVVRMVVRIDSPNDFPE